MREHVDCNPEKCQRAIKYTKLTYYESRANNPPDILYVEKKKYVIERVWRLLFLLELNIELSRLILNHIDCLDLLIVG
jgi:hypothetical protein